MFPSQVVNPERKVSLGAKDGYEVTLSSKTIRSQHNSDDEDEYGELLFLFFPSFPFVPKSKVLLLSIC